MTVIFNICSQNVYNRPGLPSYGLSLKERLLLETRFFLMGRSKIPVQVYGRGGDGGGGQ